MTYKFKQKIIRIRHSTYLKIKIIFPPKKGESMADYFQRLAESLKDKDMEKIINTIVEDAHLE